MQCMARPSGQLAQAVEAAQRGALALEPLLQAAGVSMQVRCASEQCSWSRVTTIGTPAPPGVC